MGLISQGVVYGTVLRVCFMLYSAYQDYYANLKYTDLDYSVYTDAAKYVLEGGTPYDRHTFRYTPILAYMMIPNQIWFENFGKCLFILFDILAGYMIEKILKTASPQLSPQSITTLTCMWFFNPVIFNVSTRGNADTIIAYLVLITIYLLLKQRYVLAAITFGLSVHFKIYPIIYALPMYLFIDHDRVIGEGLLNKLRGFFSPNRLIFTFISASVFIGLIAGFYVLYGWEFLYETYLYHFVRKDNRHNFSVYFYYIYLNFEGVSKLQAILAFLPQMTLVILAGVKFFKDLPFCLFIQTLAFVIFNKVCTAQYFIWYMSLLPIILANNDLFTIGKRTHIAVWVFWLVTELSWNLGSYHLEILGENAFLEIGAASTLFFIANIVLAYTFIANHKLTVFKDRSCLREATEKVKNKNK